MKPWRSCSHPGWILPKYISVRPSKACLIRSSPGRWWCSALVAFSNSCLAQSICLHNWSMCSLAVAIFQMPYPAKMIPPATPGFQATAALPPPAPAAKPSAPSIPLTASPAWDKPAYAILCTSSASALTLAPNLFQMSVNIFTDCKLLSI